MRNRFLKAVLTGLVLTLSFAAGADAQKRRAVKAQVCGEPQMRCGRYDEFKPNDLQFKLPRKAVIFETEAFYAVILQSVIASADCESHIPEEDRLEAQRLFPHNKVFSDRCPDAGSLYYTNTSKNHRFMGVYAGRTRAEANRMLETVRATGKYPTANIRRMSAGFNGT